MDVGHSDQADITVAITTFHQTYFERAVRYLFLRLGSLKDAEALAVEILAQAWWRAGDQLHNAPPPDALTFRIAHQAVADYHRTRNRLSDSTASSRLALVPSPEANPWAGTEDSEPAQKLAPQIRQLNPDQQHVLALRFGARLNINQIANALGSDKATALTLQREALRRLGAMMDDGGGSHETRI